MNSSTDPRREVAEGLERLSVWLRRTRDPRGMSASEIGVLDRLASSGPLRVTELAEREGLSQPGMTSLINRLADNGSATRGPDEADRRAILVSVTDAGRAQVADYRAHRVESITDRLAGLEDDAVEAILAALPALARLTTLGDGASTTEDREVSE
jgi:DNA-binding MarR family transcriptional regulator